jgi:hypothetical protein
LANPALSFSAFASVPLPFVRSPPTPGLIDREDDSDQQRQEQEDIAVEAEIHDA